MTHEATQHSAVGCFLHRCLVSSWKSKNFPSLTAATSHTVLPLNKTNTGLFGFHGCPPWVNTVLAAAETSRGRPPDCSWRSSYVSSYSGSLSAGHQYAASWGSHFNKKNLEQQFMENCGIHRNRSIRRVEGRWQTNRKNWIVLLSKS